MPNVNVTRQIFNVAGLYVGPTPSSGLHLSSGNSGVNFIQQIPRVQSVGIDFNVTRTNVNQFGQLAAIDRIILQPPTATLNATYLLVDGKAEAVLGFAASGQNTFISGLLDGTQDEKNYFLEIGKEGTDLIGSTDTGNNNVLAIGNGFISNYSLSLNVGQLPQASITIEGANFASYTGNDINSVPAIDVTNGQKITGTLFTLPTAIAYTGVNIVSSIRPGDVVLQMNRNASVGNYLSGVGAVNVQGLTFSIPLSRESISRLGNPFPFARKTTFPITPTLSIQALAADVREANLADVFCNDQAYDFKVIMKKPDCAGTGAPAITLDMVNAKLDTQNYSLGLQGNATVNMTFSLQIAGISQTNDRSNGFFFSGSY